MKVAFLGPFSNSYLKPFLPNLSDGDLKRAPGMGGYGMLLPVIHRIKRGKPTVLVTLDPRLQGEILKRQHDNLCLYVCPRRPKKAIRDFYARESDLINLALRDARPDIVHANWTYEYAVAALRGDYGTRALVTARDHMADILRYTGPRYLPQLLITLWVYRRARYVSAVSPYVQRIASRLCGHAVWMIPNPVPDEGTNSEFRTIRSQRIILTTASWNRLKNPKVALKAFDLVRQAHPEWELHLCGEGLEPEGEGSSWARRRNLLRNVTFHGVLSHQELIDLMGKSSLYLHTSLTEACNTAIEEAMSMAIPVVGGRKSGAVPWQLDEGRAGVLVDVNDHRSVADALRTLCDNPRYREEIGERGRSYARRMYDTESIVLQYERVYEEILAMVHEE